MVDYTDFKQMYCNSSSTHNICLLNPIIEDKDSMKLSYLRYKDTPTTEYSLSSLFKTSIYKLLKTNYITLNEEDFNELKTLFVDVYNEILKHNILQNEKDINNYILDSLNIILKIRGYNINLKSGISLTDGIALINDSSNNTLSYIKYATRK